MTIRWAWVNLTEAFNLEAGERYTLQCTHRSNGLYFERRPAGEPMNGNGNWLAPRGWPLEITQAADDVVYVRSPGPTLKTSISVAPAE